MSRLIILDRRKYIGIITFFLVIFLQFFTSVARPFDRKEGNYGQLPRDIILLKSYAETGDAWAMYKLAKEYDAGSKVDKNLPEAMKWYQDAADLGFAPAAVEIGIKYFQGTLGSVDKEKAILWFRRAYDAGYGVAAYNIGAIYLKEKNYEGANTWFNRASQLGEPSSMVQLGWMYARGIGVEKNCSKSLEFLKRSINAGNGVAFDYIHELFNNPRKTGSVTIVAGGSMTGKLTIDAGGTDSACGQPGAGGDIKIKARSFQDFKADIKTKGGSN